MHTILICPRRDRSVIIHNFCAFCAFLRHRFALGFFAVFFSLILSGTVLCAQGQSAQIYPTKGDPSPGGASGDSFGNLSANLFAQGMKLYSERDYNGAAMYFGQICDLDQNNQQARYYLTYCLMSGKQFVSALKQANLLCEKEPGNAQYMALKSHLLLITGASGATPPRVPSHGGAPRGVFRADPSPEKPHTTVVEPRLTPSFTSVPTRLPQGSTHLVSPPGGGASEPPPQATNLSPLEAAIQELDMQKFESAKNMFDQYIAKNPKDAKALHYRGMVEYQQGKYAAARDWFEKAIQVKPGSFDIIFLLGQSFFKEGLFMEAEVQFEKALKIKDDLYAKINLGESKRGQGKFDEAIEIFRKVLQKDEKQVETKLFLAEALLDKGDTEKAAETVNQVLSVDPNNAMGRYIRAKILFRSDLYDDALTSVRQAITLSPENPTFRVLLAQTLLKTNKLNEALEAAGEAIRNNPQSWEARLVLAEGLLTAGDPSSAQEHISLAEQIVQTPEITLLKGRIARKAGELAKAIQAYKSYLEADSSNGYIYLELGQVLEDSGDNDSAGGVYKEIQNKFPATTLFDTAEARLQALKMKAAAGNPIGKVEY